MSLIQRCQAFAVAVLLLLPAVTLFYLPTAAAAAATSVSGTGALPTPALVNIENDVLHFSYELERWLDQDKRPCQDFFAFVCDKTLNSTQVQLEQRLQREQEKFDRFLLSSDNDEQLMDAELKLKHFYGSCKNARSTEDLKNSFMYRMSGGWPAIDDTAVMIRKRRNMTWMDVVSAFHDTGLLHFFHYRIEIKSNKRVVFIEPNESKHYSLRKFEQLAGDVMQEYEVEARRARLIALEILNFERNRREILKTEMANDVREMSYASFKSSLLGNAMQQIDWDSYFKKILGKPLKPTDTMLVSQLPKLVQLFDLLQNTTMTRLLNWIWIDYLMDKSSTDCQNLAQHYFQPIYHHIVERSSIDKVQMAQMYAELGRVYEEILPPSTWIDEMSQQSSKQFLGRILHLTLNGDAKLDSDFAELNVTKRNFFRNLEKIQRFLIQQQQRQKPATTVAASATAIEIKQAASEFMEVFLTINTLLQQQNLTAPLNYVLVAERFAEQMIASGSSSPTPGAWRSMDSEREFSTFKQCIGRQQQHSQQQGNHTTVMAAKYNINDVILRMLAQQQSLNAFEQWQQKDAVLTRRLDSLLAAGRQQLSLRKLYFIGSVLSDCRRQFSDVQHKLLLQTYLRNSPKFTQTFRCRGTDELYARNVCKVL